MSATLVPREQPTVRAVLRVVVTVVLSVLALYLMYLLRRPLGWIVLAAFLAIAASGPVNLLGRRIPRGAAIALVYVGIVLAPIAIAAVLIPPLVRQAVNLVNNLPDYVQDVNEAFQKNERLRELNEDYDLTAKLQDLARDLSSDLGAAAGTLADVGAGLVSSLFALVTIFVLSMFMVACGKAWREAALAHRPLHQADALRRSSDRIANAVGSYVGGALAQATIAGVAAFVMLVILGVPSPLALALIIALLDLIPLVGATLGAIIVAVVTLFSDFPTDTIVWVAFAIAYQQFENYVVQPRIQSRAVELEPFIVVIAALFGAALLGVIGALLAIPAAATIQIAAREYLDYRRSLPVTDDLGASAPR